jgi:hypothetical protein
VTTSYWCRVTADGLCTKDSATMTVNVCTPPTITQQPLAVPSRIFPGSSSTLSVTATGNGPLTYQWYAGASGTTTSPVAGGTTATITVSPTAQTSYWVRVTTSVCSTDSAGVTVNMCTYPQNVTLPANVNIGHGESTTLAFPTLFPGDVKSIRWYRGASGDRTNQVLWGNVPSLNFTTPALTATTQYWVEFEHNGCYTSSTATTVTVCKPAITTQPVGATIASGTSRTLTVATTPITGQTYQWYTGAAGTTTNPIAGATSASITVSPTTTTSYWVRVKGTCTPEATTDSAAATVAVCTAPVFTTTTFTTSIQSGQQTAVGVTASNPNYTYQWYVGTSGTTTNPINGATGPMHYVSPTVTTSYWVRVTAPEGLCTANSATMTVNVCTLPTITQQPVASPQRIFSGSSSTLTVAATGNGPLTYQWYVGAPGTTTSPVSGGTTATITVTPTADTTYWVRVTTSVCSTNSAAVTVSLCTYPSTVTLPATRDVAYGETPVLAFPTVSPTNVSKYIRWYRGAAGDRTNLVHYNASATSLNYTTPAMTANTSYWVEFEHNGCLTTSSATLVRVCKPTITASPLSATILSGTQRTLTVTATGSPLTYQWFIGASGVTTQPIAGATSASLTVAPTSTTTYWVRATGCGTTADSAEATITVCQAPTIGTITRNGTSAPNSQGSMNITATGTDLTYQWYKGQTGDVSQPIAGATSTNYLFTTTVSQDYWVRVTSACSGATADSATFRYDVSPKITAHPVSTTIPRNTSTTLSVTATGTYLTYQWYQGSGTIINGATSSTLTTPVLSTGVTTFWCHVTSGSASANSLSASISLCDGPTITSFTQTYNYGSTYRLTVAVHSSAIGLVDYHWYSGVPGNVAQSTYHGESQYGHQQYFNVTTSTTYWVRVAYKDGSCYRDTAGYTLP